MKLVWLWSLFVLIKIKIAYVVCVKDKEKFVVDGKFAKQNQFPHSAGLSIKYLEGLWLCGSSIVNHRVLLTAAHCFPQCSKSSYCAHGFVKVGNVDLRRATIYAFSHYKLHAKYKRPTIDYDIAIVVTKKAMVLNVSVRRVALMEQPPVGTYHVAGWGRISENINVPKPKLLRHTRQKIIPETKCKKIVPYLKNGTICAEPEKKGYPSRADSGSALVVRRYIQVGIVSFINPRHPTTIVYTSIPYFLRWIKEWSRLKYCKGFRPG